MRKNDEALTNREILAALNSAIRQFKESPAPRCRTFALQITLDESGSNMQFFTSNEDWIIKHRDSQDS